MKFKQLNIHSFGKLKNKEIKFSDNLNVIYGRNESGKSTISAFMEAMLYSYPPRDSQRKKYIPWDEAYSQGSMTIEHNGEAITIYRTLTASSTKDTFEITPRVNIYEFIPSDRESYRKSVYCSEGKASDFGETPQIGMRIANIVSSGDENINAQRAILKLEEFRKALKPKKGSSGKLNDIENKITLLENQLERAKKEELASKEYKNELSALEKQLENLSKRRDELISSSQSDKDLALFKETEKEVEAQKAYIESFPKASLEDLKPFRFPLSFTILYILFALLLLIIGFIVNPYISFSALLPALIGFSHYSATKKQHNKKEKEILNKAGCSTIIEFRQLISDKKDAESYYLQLLKKQENYRDAFLTNLKAKEEITSISNHMLNLSGRIISLKGSFSPSGVSEEDILPELTALRAEREKISKTIAALDAAIEAITYSKDNLSKTLAPQVNEKAMSYIEKIAPKKGRSITLSKDLSLFLIDPMPRDMSSCSFGLREEIYLCYRIALSEYLYGKDFPLIFDDPFLGSDDYREKELINLFSELSKDRQVIIFTNRKNPHYKEVSCNFVDITPTFDV